MVNPKRPILLRFVFGKGLVKSRPTSVDPWKFLATNIAVNAAQEVIAGSTVDSAEQLRNRVAQDVRAELTHMASLFRRHIIRAGKTLRAPSGSLTTVAKGGSAPSAKISSGTGQWAQRSDTYLDRKRAATGGNASWFDNTAWKSRPKLGGGRTVIPSGAGLLKRTINGATNVFEDIFGAIKVKYDVYTNAAGREIQAQLRSGKTKAKTKIGRLEVRALGNITPAMLGASATGLTPVSRMNESVYADILGYDPELADRLGTMRNGVYRPTIEPFLGFFLTRAMPHAVNERIRKGSFGAINRSGKRR